MKHVVRIKRVFDQPLEKDGVRIMIDRIWPRGLTKEEAAIDDMAKDLAPTVGLRKWFGHEPVLWPEFQKKYKAELKKNEAVEQFVENYKDRAVITLVYSAKDEQHNHAIVLQDYLQHQFDELV